MIGLNYKEKSNNQCDKTINKFLKIYNRLCIKNLNNNNLKIQKMQITNRQHIDYFKVFKIFDVKKLEKEG